MPSDTSQPFDPGLIAQIRDQFVYVDTAPFCGKRIYLENAGGSLTLKTVVEAVSEWTALPDNAGRDNAASRAVTQVIVRASRQLLLLLGAEDGAIGIAESTTSNAFRVLRSIVENVPGGNLVTTKLDHPALYDSTRILAERSGKEWRVAEMCPRSGLVTPEHVLEAVDEDTVALAVIHGSNNLGTVNDIESIVKAARTVKPDLYVLVDGAQHTPHGVVDVKRLQCDGYLVSSYKTFGKPGVSAVWLSPRMAELPHDQILGKTATDWEVGTREPAGYAAWLEVMDYLYWLGDKFTTSSDKRARVVAAMEAIGRHERALTRRLLEGGDSVRGMAQLPGVGIQGETENLSVKDPAFAFTVRGMTSGDVVAYFASKGIIVHNRVSDAYSRHTMAALGIEECVRVSLCHYNTLDEVDLFLKALAEIAS